MTSHGSTGRRCVRGMRVGVIHREDEDHDVVRLQIKERIEDNTMWRGGTSVDENECPITAAVECVTVVCGERLTFEMDLDTSKRENSKGSGVQNSRRTYSELQSVTGPSKELAAN